MMSWLNVGNISIREGTVQDNKRDTRSGCVYNERERNILSLFINASRSDTSLIQ